MITYDQIKQLANEQGVPVADLIALARQNDPFYCGSTGQVKTGQWFAGLWQQFGYTDGIHLRRIHYQVVSQDPPVVKPNGKPYQNTTNDWAYLLQASKAARYLNLVDPAAFVDRRNPGPHIYRQYWGSYDPWVDITGDWRGDFDVTLPEFPQLPDLELHGYKAEQPYHLEIWCEKTTMDDILLPLCRRYGANLVTGAGELSITAALDFVKRVRRANHPARIFYIADFDPAGHGMPVSVARKMEFFLADQNLDLDIRLQPIVLTLPQVKAYRLPRTPIKPSERRKASFENRFGRGTVELDALEALYPGKLAGIVEAAILNYYDEDLATEIQQQQEKLEAALKKAKARALSDVQPNIEIIKRDFGNAVADFEASIAGLRERMADLQQAIVERLEQARARVALDDYPLLEGSQAREDNDVLYDSSRSYLDQLDCYKRYRQHGVEG